jgi:hypothetical protein
MLRRSAAALAVEGVPIMRHGCTVHRADKQRSPVALAFKNFLLGEAAVLPSSGPPR